MVNNDLKRFFDAGSIEKEFTFGDKRFIEKVAKCPKIIYVNKLGSFAAKFNNDLYPAGKKTIFSLRIDADEVDTGEFEEYLQLLRPYSKLVTVFCCASAFAGKENLLKKAKEIGLDIQSHGFYHYTYNDYSNNHYNICKADEFFKGAGINISGFAAPMGKYNDNLMLSLEALGYKYSSDFSYDYINFPHYPRLKGRFSKVLQVPIFPICPELLFANGFTLNDVVAYYDKVIEDLKESGVPIIIYTHVDKRFDEVKYFLKQLLEKMENNDNIYRINLTEFASWCAGIEDKKISQKYGLLNSAVLQLPLKPIAQNLLGVPAKNRLVKKIKCFIKEGVDFEFITPSQELQGNKLKKWLKLCLRVFLKNPICRNS